MLIAGFIVIIVVIVYVLTLGPVPGSVTTIAPVITSSPTDSDASIPAQPTCTIGITGSKVSASSIRLELVQSTCSPGEVTALQVSVNGAQVGTLGVSPGASKTFAGVSGSNAVIVIATYSNGAKSVIYQTNL
jgi:hypothetical protein